MSHPFKQAQKSLFILSSGEQQMSFVCQQFKLKFIDVICFYLIQHSHQLLCKSQFLPFIGSRHFIYKLTIFYRNMTESYTPKEFSDTADSFKTINEFSYHQKKGECNYKLLMEKQVQDILNICRDASPTKAEVQDMIKRFEKDTDNIINELLTETAQIHKKLRNQHDCYESELRQQKSKVRKLVEQNLYLTSHLQVSEKCFRQEVESLRKKLKEEKESNQSQIKGLRSLLLEYEKEMEEKTKKIDSLQKEWQTQQSLYEQAKSEIVNQSRQIFQLKQTCSFLTSTIQDHQYFRKVNENQQIDMIINQQQFLNEKMKEKNSEINLLTNAAIEHSQLIKDMTFTIQQLKDELALEKQQRLKDQEREGQMKEKFKAVSQKAINCIKEKYKTKMNKIHDLMKKELKQTKKQVENLKISLLKEVGLCFKETKGGIFSLLIDLKH